MLTSFLKFLPGLILISGCVAKKDQKKSADLPARAEADQAPRFQDNPFGASSELPAAIASRLSNLSAKPDAETLWALAQCGCLPTLRTEIFKSFATTQGSLPQTFVPRVREEIRKNKQLQLLLAIPGAFGDILKALLASDGRIADTVRGSLSEKIQKVVNADLKADIPFLFDHFPNTASDPRSFAVNDMVGRWNLVFSTGNFWRDQSPIAFENHGLQLLESLRSLSEWKYAFGLEESSIGGIYGGLMVDFDKALSPDLQRFDPRTEPDARRMLSGLYSLEIPTSGDALDLVINAKETWSRTPSAPEIKEQAMLWNAAAFAFTRLRVDHRLPSSAALYGPVDSTLLPTDAHLLPLAFLPALQGQLESKFLNKEARSVENPDLSEEKIDIRTLSRLGRALLSWIHVLAEPEKAEVSPEQLARLQAAPERFKDALRLVMLAMIKNQGLENQREIPIADLAEAISLLADIEQTLLPSPFMREQLLDAWHRLAESRLAPAWQGEAKEELNANDLLWVYMAATAVARYTPDVHEAPWLPDLLGQLEKAFGAREAFPWAQ